MEGKKLVVHKDDRIASSAVLQKDWKRFIEDNLTEKTEVALLHTRSATKGSVIYNKNNHPMYAGKSAVTHNGTIVNDDELFKQLKLKREADTDSDIIRAIVDDGGLEAKTIKTLRKMIGACAAAVVHPDYPGKLLLLRSGSPLVVAKIGDQLLWASEKQAIHKCARGWREHWGMWFQGTRVDLIFNPMVKDSAWLIDSAEKNPNGKLLWHEEFATCKVYVKPCYRTYERFNDKQEDKQRELRRLSATTVTPVERQLPVVVSTPVRIERCVLCRNEDCKMDGKRTSIDLKDWVGKQLWELECTRCGWLLAEPPKELTL